MERSTRGVVEGTKTADEADRALREIEQVSNQLAELIGSISNATQQQAASATRVAAAMNEILGDHADDHRRHAAHGGLRRAPDRARR